MRLCQVTPAVTAPQPVVKPPFRRKSIPRIDVHTHIQLGAGLRAARLLESYGIVHAVNLSGPPSGAGLEDAVADGEVAYRRLTVFTNLPWYYAALPDYGNRIAAEIPKAKAAGARGIKIAKGLGLSIRGPDGKLLRVDDPGLDPIFAAAREHDLTVHVHTSPGAASDIDRVGELVERYGHDTRIHLVHLGGGMSGHIKLIGGRFFDWIAAGKQVSTDLSWAIGFAPR